MSDNGDWLAGNLVHQITVIPGKESADGLPLANMYGEVVQGNAPERLIPCLIEVKKRREFNENTRAIVRYYNVVFGVDTKVEVDWEVKDGMNQFGDVLLKSGKITSCDPVQHISEGILGYTTTIEER